MWSRPCLLLCIVLACSSRVNAGTLHDKARAGDISFFDDNTEVFEEDDEAKAELNAREEGSGQTPLMAASLAGKHLIVDKLMRLRADPTITEKDGYTPPHGVAFQGRAEAARALIKHDVAIDVAHSDGFTPLHRTVWGKTPQHMLTAKILVKEGGADVNHRDHEGFTPAHRALVSGWMEMVKTLLELGAKPNIKNREFGETMLHTAVKNQDAKVVKLLLEFGGDITVKNKKGESPLDMATRVHSAEVKTLMERASVKRRREIFGAGDADEKKDEL